MREVIEARRPFKTWQIQEWIAYRFVLLQLTIRDLKLRYKSTALGVLWVLLQPLLTALVLTAIFGKFSSQKAQSPYLLFSYVGLIPWLIFSQAIIRSHTCLIGDTRLITRVYFPRIFLPLSAVFGLGCDFLVMLIFGLVLKMQLAPGSPWNVSAFALSTLSLFFLLLGTSFLFSSITVFFRDLKHIVPFLIQFLLFASPLAYSAEQVPASLQFVYSLNPLVGIIEGFRASFCATTYPPSLLLALIESGIILIVGLFCFQKLQRSFCDHL